MVEKCVRCERDENNVNLVKAIDNNEVISICENCAMLENIPIMRKPTLAQLENINKTKNVKDRMAKISGVNRQEKPEEKFATITLDNLRKPKDYKTKLDTRFAMSKTHEPINLIDNFHWDIVAARRKMRISRHQLAERIGESELAVELLENKQTPEGSLRVINKLEQFFGIKLKKEDLKEKEELIAQLKAKKEADPNNFSFDSEMARNLTIADLKKMKEEQELLEQERAKTIETQKPSAFSRFSDSIKKFFKKEESAENVNLEENPEVSPEKK